MRIILSDDCYFLFETENVAFGICLNSAMFTPIHSRGLGWWVVIKPDAIEAVVVAWEVAQPANYDITSWYHVDRLCDLKPAVPSAIRLKNWENGSKTNCKPTWIGKPLYIFQAFSCCYIRVTGQTSFKTIYVLQDIILHSLYCLNWVLKIQPFMLVLYVCTWETSVLFLCEKYDVYVIIRYTVFIKYRGYRGSLLSVYWILKKIIKYLRISFDFIFKFSVQFKAALPVTGRQ